MAYSGNSAIEGLPVLERGPPPLPGWLGNIFGGLGGRNADSGGQNALAIVPSTQQMASVGLPPPDSPFWQRWAPLARRETVPGAHSRPRGAADSQRLRSAGARKARPGTARPRLTRPLTARPGLMWQRRCLLQSPTSSQSTPPSRPRPARRRRGTATCRTRSRGCRRAARPAALRRISRPAAPGRSRQSFPPALSHALPPARPAGAGGASCRPQRPAGAAPRRTRAHAALLPPPSSDDCAAASRGYNLHPRTGGDRAPEDGEPAPRGEGGGRAPQGQGNRAQAHRRHRAGVAQVPRDGGEHATSGNLHNTLAPPPFERTPSNSGAPEARGGSRGADAVSARPRSRSA